MKKALSALTVILLLIGRAGSARCSFVASPMEHHLKVAAGRGETVTITLRNTGPAPLTVKLYLSDSSFGPNGSEDDLPAGTMARSCAPWLTMENQLLELKPEEVKSALLRLAVPDTARGSYWTKVFIEEISNPEPRRQVIQDRSYQVFIKQRMGVRVFEDVPGTVNPDALVRLVRVEEATGGGREITTYVVNSGNALLDCRGRVELRNSRGEVAEVLTYGKNGSFWVFPGGERSLSVVSRAALPPETYTALSIVDFGGEHLVAGEEVFRIAGDGALTVHERLDR
jgi:hypothetical protein